MTELSYAAILVELTGLVSLFLGIYIQHSKKDIAYGFGTARAAFEVTDQKAYNKEVGMLWLYCGIAVCLLGLLLVIFGDRLAIFVAIAAIAVYVAGSARYVLTITKKYRKVKDYDELWKDVR